MSDIRVFKCKGCANVLLALREGPCTPQCCGEPMELLVAGSVDAAKEKHVPEVTVDGDAVRVQVGAVKHPMLDNHSIKFVVLKTDRNLQVKTLQPGQEPAACFNTDGEKPEAVYEFCDLHGLWKKEL